MIVEAIHRAREVFRRMTNYAIYRITETIRVVLFVAFAIVAFDFFPVTPTQIVLLAILNDAAILTIAYDRVLPSPRPERWDMREVLTIATVLGLSGVVESSVAALDRPRPARPLRRRGAHAALPEALGRRAPDPVRRPHPRPAVVAPAGDDRCSSP